MEVQNKVKRARATLDRLTRDELDALEKICLDIRDAQEKLLEKSAETMTRCLTACEGLCCRNVQLGAIVSYWDFIYILTMAGEIRDSLRKCLTLEEPFAPRDCIFLKNGQGPCIFPQAVRPETCIVSFCTDEPALRKEIADVKKAFFKLQWHLRFSRLKSLWNEIREKLGVSDESA